MDTRNYAALKAELANDPLALGYKNASDSDAATLIDTPSVSTLVPTAAISTSSLFGAINQTEFLTMTIIQLAQLQCILSLGNFDLNSPASQKILFKIVGPQSVTALQALATRPGSRAEVLFGTGTVVTSDDVNNVRVGNWP